MKRVVFLFFFSLLVLHLYANGNQDSSQTSSFYTGDGGKGTSITIKVLTAEGLPPSLSNTRVLAYRGLIDNFSKYSAMSVKRDSDFDDTPYRDLLSGYYDDYDETGGDRGYLTVTDYFMTGSITRSSSGYYFSLQVYSTAASTHSAGIWFAANCTYSDLSDLSIVNRASLDLLEQMGVKLTEKAHTELAGTAVANRVRGRTVMTEAVAAQRAGDEAKARFLLFHAVALDARLAEEAERLLSETGKQLTVLPIGTIPPPALRPLPQMQAFVPTPERQVPPPAETTGNAGNDASAAQQAYDLQRETERIRREVEAENVRIRAENERRKAEVDAENARRKAEVDTENTRRLAAVAAENEARDAHNRETWVKALADTERFYRNYLSTSVPFELVYEHRIEQMPETQDIERGTISAKFNAALVPAGSEWARAIENDLNSLRLQLLDTGKAAAWGLANWPRTPVTTPLPFVDRNERVTAVAELLNYSGEVLISQTFSLEWNLAAIFSARGLIFSISEDDLSSKSVIFANMIINDITDTLQIRIAGINGEDAERVASQGRMQYSTDYQRWRLLEQGRNRQVAQEETVDAKAAGRFLLNYILPVPHYLGVGTTFTTPLLTLSAYNRMLLGRKQDIIRFYLDYGCDFGFLHGNADKIKDVFYYSFYPNAHIGAGFYGGEEAGDAYLGIGGGYMFSTYIFDNKDTGNAITPAIDFKIGARVVFVDVSYSMRFAMSDTYPINHKVQVGFRVIPQL
jgi:hypothetical protein